jgi:hypothetical protein
LLNRAKQANEKELQPRFFCVGQCEETVNSGSKSVPVNSFNSSFMNGSVAKPELRRFGILASLPQVNSRNWIISNTASYLASIHQRAHPTAKTWAI